MAEALALGSGAAVLQKIRPDRVIQLLSDAVDTYSPSWAEAPATRLFAAALARAGLPHALEPLPDDPSGTRANLVVRLGPEPLELMWVGHLDTVTMPEGIPHGAQRRDGRLYGLGSADMKGGCAAMVEALISVRDAGIRLRRGCLVAFVVGEEEYGDGAIALLQRHPPPAVTVIGEPTGLAPCLNHYGYLECLLTAEGTGAHAALPEFGRNAIQAMLGWLSATLDALHGLPDADALAINLRRIGGGSEKFVVPDRCEALLDVHLPPHADPAEVLQRIGAARAAVGSGDVRLDSRAVFCAPGHELDAGDARLQPLRRALQAVGLAWAPGTFRSHSDAALFRQAGSWPVLCGPGRLEVAHSADEHVAVAEVVQAARLYAALVCEACG